MPRTVPDRAREPGRRLRSSPYAWIATIYVVTWLALPAGEWINDNGLKRIQTTALRDSAFADFSLVWPGEALDPGHRFQPIPPPLGIVRDGKLFASYPPAFALLAVGPYALLGRAGLAFWPLVGALLLLPAVARLARQAQGGGDDGSAASVAVWLVGLGTPLWFYAATFWEHTLSLAIAAWCLLVTVRFRERPETRRALAVGALAAAGAWLRTDAYLLAAIVAGLGLARRGAGVRPRAALLGALAAGLSPLWLFQASTLGHPLGLHLQSQQWETLTWSAWLADRAEVASVLLLNCHPLAWLSAAVAAPFWVGLAWRPRLVAGRRGALLVAVAAGATLVTVAVVAVGIFGHARPMVALVKANGLFAAAPFALFALLRRPDEDGGARAARRTLLGALLLLAGLYAGLVPAVNAGGLHWGCRFLLTCYPILAALAAPVVVHAWRQWPRRRAFVIAAFAACIALQGSSVALLGARKAFDARVNRAVEAARPPAIVTDVWFLPATLAESFHRQPILLASGARGMRDALRALARHGIDEALLITGEPFDGTAGDDPRVLTDGWPGLATLRLRHVRTSPLEARGTGGGS